MGYQKGKKLLGAVILVVFALSASFCIAAEQETGHKGPEFITLQAKRPITFPHWLHQDRGVNCKICHENSRVKESGWDKDTGHAICVECHKSTGASFKCITCHNKKK